MAGFNVRTHHDQDRYELVDFAKQSGNEFYFKALAEIETAEQVVRLAREELEEATKKLAMQVKLMDNDAYMAVALDHSAMKFMSAGEKVKHMMSKGKYKLGMSEKLLI